MPDPILKALLFLVTTLVDLYVFVLLTRLLLVYTRTPSFSPLFRLLGKLSDPLIRPLKKIAPTIKRWELATLLLIYLLQSLKFFCIGLLALGFPHLPGFFLLPLAAILKAVADLFFYAILVEVLLSWIPTASPDLRFLLSQITSPIMRPLHRLIPPLAGLDLTPIPALIGLQLLGILLLDPFYDLSLAWTFSG